MCWSNFLKQGTDLADKTPLERLFQSLIVEIENIQRQACIILTGAIRVTRHKTLLKEAGVEPFKTRRTLHR
jgi:hypothetical protein